MKSRISYRTGIWYHEVSIGKSRVELIMQDKIPEFEATEKMGY